MGKLTVIIDSLDSDMQIYGAHKYNTSTGWLYKKSSRKHYPDVLCKNRTEKCIKEAIFNYNKELDEKINQIMGRK